MYVLRVCNRRAMYVIWSEGVMQVVRRFTTIAIFQRGLLASLSLVTLGATVLSFVFFPYSMLRIAIVFFSIIDSAA